MPKYPFDSPEFDAAVAAAGRQAFEETLAAGRPVFYVDRDLGFPVMEQPDGRRFEISWIPGAPAGSNYKIVQEVSRRAA
jgi:hypothetical protein